MFLPPTSIPREFVAITVRVKMRFYASDEIRIILLRFPLEAAAWFYGLSFKITCASFAR